MATVLTAGNITGAIAGLEYTIPITISNPLGEDISAMDLQINFDPVEVQFVSAIAGALTQGWSIVPNLDNGSISLQSPTSIPSGTGVILNLKFKVLPGASGLIQIDIDEQASGLMEGGVGFSAVDGSITLAPPSVSSVSFFSNDGSQNGYLNDGDVVIVRVLMSSAVVVNGAPELNLNIGGSLVKASYLELNSTPSTGELFFTYIIEANLTDANGISIPADSFSLAAGVTIEDSAGQAAILSHAAVNDAASYKVDTTVARPIINSAGGTDNIVTNPVGDRLIQGTAEANALVLLYPVDSQGHGASFATATASASGAWSYVLTDDDITMLGQGIGRSIVCTATDSAGNESVDSLNFNFAIFTQIPEPPIIDAIGGPDSLVTADAGDNTVVGTGLAGGTVRLYVQTTSGSSALLGSTTVTAEGSWSYSLSNSNLISIGRGTGRVITATAADPFGSTSGSSDPFSFESTAIEAPPNNPPSLTLTSSITPVFSSNSGLVDGAFVASFITSDPDNNSVSVSLSDTSNYILGTGSNSGKVLLTPAGLALVNSGQDLPAFTLTPNDGSTDGPAVSVDPSVSSEPRISSIQLVSATDAQNGYLNIGDTVTAQVKLSEAVDVQGIPRLKLVIGGATVEASYNANDSTPSNGELLFNYTIIAGQADENGISIPADALMLTAGASIKDTDGKSAILTNPAVSDQQNFQVDTSIAAPEIHPIGGSDLIIADTGSDSQISGTAEANAIVMLAFNDSVFATIEASTTGSWSYDITAVDIELIGQGPNKSITVTAEDAAGNFASTPSAPFSIHTQPPPPPIISTIGGDDGIVSSSAGDNAVQGRAQAGSTLLLYAGTPTTIGTAFGTVTVNQQGEWSYELTPSDLSGLGEGPGRSLFAMAQDPLGQTSQPSLPSDFVIDTKGPTIQSVALVSSEGARNGKLNPGDRVTAKISFSEAVIATIDPAPVLRLRIGSAVVEADYVTSDGGPQHELLFDYTIKTGQTDLDGISIDANSLILPGNAGIEDSLGNPADLSHAAVVHNAQFQVDTTVSAPIVTDVGGSDRTISTVQNDNLIQGTAEAGATVSILVNDGVISAVTASDTGQWIYALTEENIEMIGQGSAKKLTVTAEDTAGNRSGPSNEFQFTVQSLRPDPPIIATAGGNDQTISSRTADNIITGTAPAGSTVSLDAGTTSPETTLGITTASAQGNWSYVITSANLITLGQGSGKTITATAIDSVGNRSAASQPFTLTIDTVKPTMTSINLLNILINGEGAENGFLNDGDIVAVDVEMSELVIVEGLPILRLQIGSTLVDAEYVPGDSDPDTGRLRFTYIIQAQQTDTDGISLPANPIVLPSGVTISDGNGNPADLTFAATGAQDDFKVDTSVLPPVITAVGGSDTIVTTEDRLVTGTAEPFAGVFLIDDLGNFLVVDASDQPQPIATANGSGEWSYALTDHDLQIIGQGSGRVLTAAVKDAAGNQSTQSDSFSFSVYSEKPQAPNIDQAGTDDGIITSISGDNLITGTAVAGCNVTLFKADTNTILGTASVDLSGRWSYTLTTANLATLGQGTGKSLTAITTDPTSQQSDRSDPFAFAIDTLGPTISSIVLESDDASLGYLSIGDIVTAKVTMSGESKVSGTPILKLQIGSAIVNAGYDSTASNQSTGDLRFTYTILAGQTDNAGISIPINALTLPANTAITDELGNAADLSNQAIGSNPGYKVDTSTDQPTFTSTIGGSDNTVSSVSGDNVISGKAEAHAIITVSKAATTGSSATILGVASASAAGDWSYEFVDPDYEVLGQGTGKIISVEAEDRAGNKASATSVAFVIDTEAPLAPTIQSIGTDNIVSSNANDNVVRGTAVGANKVSLYLGDSATILGTVTVNTQGEWTYGLTPTNLNSLGEGDRTITAKASDTAGNLSAASSEFSFVFDQTAPRVNSAIELFSNDSQNNFLNTGDTVTAKLTMSEPVFVTGRPILKLQIGNQSVDAAFASVSESELFFDYKIIAGQSDSDGISIKVNSLTLPAGAAIKDAAGNNATLTHAELTNQANLMVDTTITIPTISSVGGSDKTITAASDDKMVVGKADPGAIVALSAGTAELNSVTASATGDWSYELSEADINSIGQGSGKSITATAKDLAGNESAASAAFGFGVFTLIPAAPTIEFAGGDDSIVTNLSNDKRIQGSAPGASKVTLFVAATSTSLGTVTVNAQGEWSYELTPANLTTLGQGAKTITAKASDVVGQLSLASEPFPFTIDITAPSVKSIALIDAEGGQAGLLNAGDVVTAKVTMSEPVSVGGAPVLKLVIGTANVEASFNREQSSGDSLIFTYTIGDTQADANGIAIPANALTITSGSAIADLGGNPAVVTSNAVVDNPAFKVDTTTSTPTITGVGGLDRTVTTAANDQLVTGTAEAGAVVSFQSGDNPFGLTTASANGSWSYALIEADLEIITQGFDKTITATSIDPAGNSSAPSSPFSFRVATQPPPAPVIENAGNVDIISAANLAVSGSSEINSRVVLFVGDTTTVLGTATANSQGRWSYTLTTANITSLGQGPDRELTATAADSFNNVSGRSDTFLATVDTIAPTVTSVILEAATGAQNGFLNVGDTVTAMVTMSEPVSVLESASPTLKLQIGTTSVNANFNREESAGEFLIFNYTILASQADADGISIPANALTIPTGALTDLAGNKAKAPATSSAVSNNAAYKVDTTILNPKITEVGGLPDKIVTTKANDNLVKGTAEAGATVFIKSGDIDLGEATADSKGGWVYILSNENIDSLGQGAGKTITASAEDLAGNKSGSSAAFSFTVATEPPPAPLISQAGSDDQKVISSASGDNLISGTAQIGTKVTLFTANANAAIATVTVSSQGKWSYALSSANITSIGQGEGKTITAKATDAVGNISDSSDAFPFEVDTSAPKVNAILIESAEGIQNSFLNKDDIVTAKVTMSDAVKVSGAPTLKLLVGTTSVNATYDAIASSDEYLVFNYKIQANQSDADGISIPGSALTLGTGVSITDLAGNKAVVTSSAVSNNAAYKVDTTIAKPTITEVGGTDKIVVSSTASDAVVKGTAEANAVVIIRTGTGPSLTPLGTVTASSTGSWSYSLSPANVASIGYGTGRSVTATATDPAGNLSDTSAPFSFAAYDTLLNGSTANETINGTDGVDSLNGAAGNDIITGKAGGDFIALGAGKDTLVFGGSGSPGSMVISAASVLANLGRDSITDYSVADDSIQLSQAAFGSLATGATGALSSSKFTTVASATTAITRDYRDGGFLYNSGTGDLLYTTANLSNQAINSLLFAGDSANAAIIANFVNKPALVSTEFSVTP